MADANIIAVLVWRRSYASRFTLPGRTPLVLRPGTNKIGPEHLEVLQHHRATLKDLEREGHLEVTVGPEKILPPRRRDRKQLEANAVRVKARPPEVIEEHIGPLVIPDDELERARKIAAGELDPDADPDRDPDADPDVAGEGQMVEGKLGETTMPPWAPDSSYEELKLAASARSIEFGHNVSKAKLLELLEAWDDEQLINAEPDGDAVDGDGAP